MKLLSLSEYQKIIVAFSGGKDSLAAVLKLLEMGVPKSQIELWHHDIDGAPGTRGLMDWPCTRSYVKAAAAALGLDLYFSWREGGFEREMLRNGTATAPVVFEDGQKNLVKVGGNGPGGTRLKFPQVSAALQTRWCSSYLKIDVGRRVFSNDPRFSEGNFLLVTGERREESPARAQYDEIEEHKSTNLRRRVDQWRTVIDWKEEEVWAIMERHRIRPHPAYELGWGRVSCALCIFGDKNQWRSARELMPDRFERVASYEEEFGVTIKRKFSVRELADKGQSFLPSDPELRALALAEDYPQELILVGADEAWKLPAGAYKHGGGPS